MNDWIFYFLLTVSFVFTACDNKKSVTVNDDDTVTAQIFSKPAENADASENSWVEFVPSDAGNPTTFFAKNDDLVFSVGTLVINNDMVSESAYSDLMAVHSYDDGWEFKGYSACCYFKNSQGMFEVWGFVGDSLTHFASVTDKPTRVALTIRGNTKVANIFSASATKKWCVPLTGIFKGKVFASERNGTEAKYEPNASYNYISVPVKAPEHGLRIYDLDAEDIMTIPYPLISQYIGRWVVTHNLNSGPYYLFDQSKKSTVLGPCLGLVSFEKRPDTEFSGVIESTGSYVLFTYNALTGIRTDKKTGYIPIYLSEGVEKELACDSYAYYVAEPGPLGKAYAYAGGVLTPAPGGYSPDGYEFADGALVLVWKNASSLEACYFNGSQFVAFNQRQH